jgi:small-conductance mechanosensitive channel
MSEIYYEGIDTIPTVIVMCLSLLAGFIILYIVKKLVLWGLMKCARQRYGYKKWIARDVERKVGSKLAKITWESKESHYMFNYIHIFIESLFFIGLLITLLLAASFGGINVWQNPIALSVITVAVGYVFAAGLQQLGSGYFFFLTNYMSPGEWWEQVGGGISGRVINITPFYVEFETLNIERTGALIQRAGMSTVIMSNWQRNYHKEDKELAVTAEDEEQIKNKIT